MIPIGVGIMISHVAGLLVMPESFDPLAVLNQTMIEDLPLML